MNRSDCPDPAQLLELLGGKSDSESAQRLEAHLLACEPCALSAETLFPENEVTAFRESTPIQFEDSRDERIVEALIHRGKALRTDLATVAPEQTQIGMSMDDDDVPGDSKASRSESDSSDDLSYLAPPQQPDEIGRLGDYRILQVLGRGGMGVVFRAEDPRLKRQVALKVMKPSIAASRSAKDRFLREAQFTAAIEHDHIVHIYQVGEDRGVPFIAMPFLKGESLKTKLEREGRLRQSEVVRIGKEVASGLAAAHERGLIHRDIKPDNIWIEEKTGRAKILDFGLVRSVSDDTELTQSGMVLGTPKYMAPEQAQGQSVDHRCDLFSLGSMLYHLATGKPAFEGNNLTATLMAVVHHEPQPIEVVSPDIHPQLATLVAELVKKNRDQRPQTASLVSQQLADIEQVLKNPSAVTAGSLETLSNGSRSPIESLVSSNIAEVTIVPQPVLRRTPPKPPRSNMLTFAAGAGGLLLMLGILIITIRDKDGKETTVRVPSGVVADIDVQPGSKVSIREEAPGASDATDTREMKSPVVAEKELQAHNGNNVGKAAFADKPKLWPVGPLPTWASEEPRWPTMKESFTIPGVVERPTEFKGIGRWNVDTVHSRGLIVVARYSPDSKWLATGGSDGHVRIYEAASMKLHQLMPGIGGGVGVGDLSWHPDSQQIAIAADNGNLLRIWKVDGQLVHEEFPDNSLGPPLKAIAWTFDGSRLICAGSNRLDIRDKSGLVIKSLTEAQPFINTQYGILAVSPNSQRFVCWHDDKARIWNAETYELEQTIDFPSSGSHRIRWSSKDRISLSLPDRLVICDAGGSVLKEFPSESLCATAWRPDGEHLTIWRDNPYDLNPESGESTPANERIYVSAESALIPTAIDWSPDGKHLAVAAGRLAVCNESLNRMEFDSGATLTRLSSISLNPSGTLISSVGDNDNCIRIWTSDGTAQRIMPLNEPAFNGGVAWSPDGSHIAVLSPHSNRLRIGESEGRFREVAGRYSSLAWNLNGTQLATGTWNGHIMILDRNGQTLHDIETGESTVVTVGWSKQGMLVAHAGKRVYHIHPDSTESKISLLTEVPGNPAGQVNVPTWRPDGREVFFPGAFHVNVADDVTERIRQAPAAAAWAPDSSRYLGLEGGFSLHQLVGSILMGRLGPVSHYYCASAWSPAGDTVYVGCDQSLLMAHSAEDLRVKWSTVILPKQKSITFDVGGSVLDADRETLDGHFVYYTADEAGNVSLLSPTEFELRTGEEILSVPGRYFDSEYRFAITTGDAWKPSPLEAFTVPGIARAVFSKAGGVSLNLFIQDTGDLVDASWMLAESAKAQEEKLSATVLEKEVRKVAGRDAMWMIVEGQGTGSAITGIGPVRTTQHWIAIPREKDVVVALLTSPSGTFAANQALFLKAIETLQLRGVNSTP